MNLNKNSSFYQLSITKQMLIKGLLDLMEKDAFEGITITRLCDYAEVGRKTYYRHYRSKHELLIHYLSILMEDSMEAIYKLQPDNLQELLISFLTIGKDNKF